MSDLNSATISVHYSLEVDGCFLKKKKKLGLLTSTLVDANSATINVHYSLDADGCFLKDKRKPKKKKKLGLIASTFVDANSSPSTWIVFIKKKKWDH
jgi:hypothetical protein